ncbi:hypothetical protein G8C92_26715 [Paenibacillus donghaensis]|uniref:hypothetical protein n=1 Tax=Paenibacillus donghaensis TaxID=414771 RepID=UPI001883FB31|nr:hypothetical protein [Paenibacillus donghaensis]MBE9917612.1 hypothetical protein [Paenibacillus donghaensis]
MNWTMTDQDYKILKKDLETKLIENNVSSILIHELFETFDDPDSTEEDFTSMQLRILSGLSKPEDTNFYYNNSRKSVIKYIEDEIFKLICLKDEEYAKERTSLFSKYESIIALVSASISAKFGLESGLISGLVSSMLLAIFKMGKNAWCVRKSDLSKETNK